MANDFYEVLGVGRKATPNEIRKSYYQLAKELHPDKNKGNKLKEKEFQLVGEAYSVLSDEQKRAEYDFMQGYTNTKPDIPSYTHSEKTPEQREKTPEQKEEILRNKINKAAMEGNIKALEEFLAQGINLEGREYYARRHYMVDEHGPLYHAISKQQIKTIKWLLDHGVNINSEPYVFLTLALDANNIEIVNFLFAAGIKVDVNANKFCDNYSALAHICYLVSSGIMNETYDDLKAHRDQCIKTVDMARIILAHGAEVNQTVNRMTALQYAIRSNNVELVRFLLANGANINMKDDLRFAVSIAFNDRTDRTLSLNLEIIDIILTEMKAKKNDPLTPQSLKSAIKECESMAHFSPSKANNMKKILEDFLNANYSYSILSGYQAKPPTKPMIIEHLPNKAPEGTISLKEAQAKQQNTMKPPPPATQEQKVPPPKPAPKPPKPKN